MMRMMNKGKISVIGAGSWGTAIASVLADKGVTVNLWAHRKSHVEDLKNDNENKKYLPGYSLHTNILPTNSLEECTKDCSIICMVVPSHVYRSVFNQLLPYLKNDSVVVSATKGIENDSLQTMSQVMHDCVEKAEVKPTIDLAVLSGPSFAWEVIEKKVTAVTIGCENVKRAEELQQIFSHYYLRVYTTEDVLGLEICGALKNIIAVATGISDGLGYGLNSRAALISRGLTEIARLGESLGGKTDSFYGLGGFGDLLLTCTSEMSRNRTVGFKLGQGMTLEEILEEMDMVAEGVKTTKSVYKLAQELKLDMPILEQVYKILYENKDCSLAVRDLLSRDLKPE